MRNPKEELKRMISEIEKMLEQDNFSESEKMLDRLEKWLKNEPKKDEEKLEFYLIAKKMLEELTAKTKRKMELYQNIRLDQFSKKKANNAYRNFWY